MMLDYPSRDIVRSGGVYDPRLEHRWEEALDAYFAQWPSGPEIASLPVRVLPPGCKIMTRAGMAYLCGYDPAQHDLQSIIAAGIAHEETDRQRSEARATRRAQLRAFRDGTGDLTARQLTMILRVLAREVLGED